MVSGLADRERAFFSCGASWSRQRLKLAIDQSAEDSHRERLLGKCGLFRSLPFSEHDLQHLGHHLFELGLRHRSQHAAAFRREVRARVAVTVEHEVLELLLPDGALDGAR